MSIRSYFLQQAVIDGIANTALSENIVMHWSNKDVRILNILIQEGAATKEKVLEEIHELLKKIGRSCYEEYIAGEYSDHVLSPQAFAYALLHDEFSPREEGRILFDYGDTKQTFIESYIQDIQQAVFKQLTTEQKS